MHTKLIAMVVTLTALISLTACKNGTDPNDEPQLIMQTEMNSSTVVAGGKSEVVQGERVIDSIRITRARVLISRIKLHTAEDGDDDNKGKDVKTGPAVIDFQRDKVFTVFSTPIPTGKYEKIKLEMHKFSQSEANTWTGDPVFGPFAFPEKITLIVDGTVYANGSSQDFTWTDDETANIWVRFDPFIEVSSSSRDSVVLNFDPVVAFRVSGGGSLLDPLNLGHKATLRSKMWTAFHIRRK